MSIKVEDNNKIPELIKEMESIKASKLEVGVQEEKGSELYMVARVHEYGANIKVTPSMRGYFISQGMPLRKNTKVIKIPERSYLRSGYDANEARINSKIDDVIEEVTQGKMSSDEAREQVGELTADVIRNNVTGVGLVKEGDLRDSIDYRVVSK